MQAQKHEDTVALSLQFMNKVSCPFSSAGGHLLTGDAVACR